MTTQPKTSSNEHVLVLESLYRHHEVVETLFRETVNTEASLVHSTTQSSIYLSTHKLEHKL